MTEIKHATDKEADDPETPTLPNIVMERKKDVLMLVIYVGFYHWKSAGTN